MKRTGAAVAVLLAALVAIVTQRELLSRTGSSGIEAPAVDTAAPEPAPRREATADAEPSTVARPRRFRSPDDRRRFAQALARARRAARDTRSDAHESHAGAPSRQPESRRDEQLGELDKDYVRDRVADIVPLVAECYELALVNAPSLAGQLVIDFVIDAEQDIGGYVSEAAVADDSELKDAALSECVTETILSLEFVEPRGGGVVRVRYPFRFERHTE